MTLQKTLLPITPEAVENHDRVFIAYLTLCFVVVSKLEYPEPWVVMERRKSYLKKNILTQSDRFI